MPRIRSLVAMGVGAIAAVAFGCGGHSSFEPPGGADAGSDATFAVSVSGVLGAVAACRSGYAHPNICCKGGGCIERAGHPFAACSDGALTFPARDRCCALNGSENCVAAPGVDGGADAAPGPGACSLPCGPEGHLAGDPMSGAGQPACDNASVAGPCLYCCSGESCTSNFCRCPEASPDASSCACNTPSCGACPDGWTVPAPQVDLCCRARGKGATECFSQSTGVSSAEQGGSWSGSSGCGAYTTSGGHLFEISCDAATPSSCTCTIDGV